MITTENKVAIVTGSSRGIGAGIAEYLIQKGFLVYVTYLEHEEEAKERFSKYELAKIVKLDLNDEESVKKVFAQINNEVGKLDLLVNSASIEIPGTTEEIGLDVLQKIFNVRVFGTFLATKYALPLLKKSENPVIVNISSALSLKGQPKYPAHTAAEAAINSYTKTCAIDFAHYGIRCHTVMPTMTRTGMWQDIGGYEDDKLWNKFAENNPLGRVSTPEDVGKAVYLLTTDEAKFWNGDEIYVNGGSHLK